MIKKISSILFILVITVCIVTGCDTNKDKEKDADTSSKVKSVDDLEKKSGVLECKRDATVEGGSGTFNYTITYNGEDITYINSIEKIESDDPSVLKQYEESYNTIDEYYVGIDHYYAKVDTTSNSVTHIIKIDYEKIDIQKLIDLEGEEDNIFENNKAKLSKYFTLAKKLGITCSESTL